MSSNIKSAAAVVAAVGFIAGASAAQAKQVCGWYAIAYCSASKQAVVSFANNGWGSTIMTSNFSGLKPGQYCAVSGPQTRECASRDRDRALYNRVSPSAYIKQACADARFIGD